MMTSRSESTAPDNLDLDRPFSWVLLTHPNAGTIRLIMPPTDPSSGNLLTDLGIPQPDIEVAKADLAIRIHQLNERRQLTPDEAAAVLNVPKPDLPALFQGRLATCSIDQLLRLLTWLGDDIELVIRPRLQRKRGSLRVLQAAAVERPDDFEPVRLGRGKRRSTTRPDACDEKAEAGSESTSSRPREDRLLLDKHSVEKMTSLDITTIYRKMAAGTFPQPVKVGRRRVAWRASDVVRWQQNLAVGTDTARWRATRSRQGGPHPDRTPRRSR
jgi:predicted DNA-binding transcriptional regulator AlpA/predicted XRE-type DNA-binding protein